MDEDRRQKEGLLEVRREQLASLNKTYAIVSAGRFGFPDGGAKLRARINVLENEIKEIVESLRSSADAPSTNNATPQPYLSSPPDTPSTNNAAPQPYLSFLADTPSTNNATPQPYLSSPADAPSTNDAAPQPYLGQSGTRNKKRSKIFDFLDHGNFKSELLADRETRILFGSEKFASGPSQSPEEQKVAYLYSVLTRVGYEAVTSDVVFEALIDLCRLDNEVILYRSLRVLHKALTDICPMDAGSNQRVRENVIIERPSSGENVKVEGSTSVKSTEKTSGLQFDDFSRTTRSASPKSSLDWIDVFKLMSQIATRNIKERTKLEAVTVMNLLLRRTNAYGEDRQRFGRVLGYQAIIQLLDEKSGVDVQKEAVKLLFLLVNCPAFKATFLSDCKKLNGDALEVKLVEEVDAEEIDGIHKRLSGLIASRGKSTAELKLRRKVIELWGFLVTSSGFEAFVSYLKVILPMLGSEVDAGDPNMWEEEVHKERTLLIMEVLIHINQLLSQPRYKKDTLKHMMYDEFSRSLVVDVASRLSRDPKRHFQTDIMDRVDMNIEVAALARAFKDSVFRYLDKHVGIS